MKPQINHVACELITIEISPFLLRFVSLICVGDSAVVVVVVAQLAMLKLLALVSLEWRNGIFQKRASRGTNG